MTAERNSSDSACCAAGRDHESDEDAGARLGPESTTAANADTGRMVEIDGGSFLMGTDDEGFPADGEGPVREVSVDSFYIDRYHVTNADFVQFVRDTGYTTDAEKFGWSFVFQDFVAPEDEEHVMDVVPDAPWWCAVEGATWYQPDGPSSSIEDRLKHPVVHVSWRDAQAYCEWSGKRLPTEAEWEYAARGGLEQKRFPWGDELNPDGQHRCNIWQGSFPDENTGDDGYLGTAPVTEYEPNGYGLYNVSGNAWEWVGDWFSATYHRDGPRDNPIGPPTGDERVMRGGSYLCHDSYCNRYRVAARSKNSPDSSTGNIGFRCVVNAE